MGINQLVDAYKGNPAPLQAKVQQAQKNQPPGAIPPDLEEAIALQKISELRNSAQGQQDIQAGGAQPSIVEKLRQMLAASQRQQAQPPQMPQGMPQDQPQMAQEQPPMPQGQPVMAARGGSIDQLMSNLGRHYTGGGIVTFNGKDGSNVPTEAELEAQRKADREKINALARALGETGGEYAGKSMAALADIASLIPRGLAGAVDTALVRPARALGANIDYLSPALTPGNQSSDTMTPFYDRYIRAKEEAVEPKTKEVQKPSPTDPNFRRQTDPRISGTPATAPNVPLITSAPAERTNVKPAVREESGSMPAAGLAGLPSIGVGRDYLQRSLADNQKFDEKAYREKYLKEVGAKDLSIYDEMSQELKARKERLNAPAKGYDSLMEYLGQIAQSGGGRSWMESGAKGAAGVKALQKSRQDQQDTLVDKILDLGAKKKEAEYGERLGMFNLTKAEKDKINKESAELAKSLNLSETEAEKMRQQSIESELNRKVQKEIHGLPGAEQRFFNQMANSWLAQPANKGKTMFDAYTAFKIAGAPSAAGKGVMNRPQATDDVRLDLDGFRGNTYIKDATEALKATGVSKPSMLDITEYLIQKKMNPSFTGSASSATVPPLPAKYKLD